MNLSTRSTYGLRAMVKLAKIYPKSLSTAEISKNTGISVKYLEAILNRLQKSGVIISQKGAKGGYCLSKKPADLDLWMILSPLEESFPAAHCRNVTGKVLCSQACACGVGLVMNNINKAIRETLSASSLADIK